MSADVYIPSRWPNARELRTSTFRHAPYEYTRPVYSNLNFLHHVNDGRNALYLPGEGNIRRKQDPTDYCAWGPRAMTYAVNSMRSPGFGLSHQNAERTRFTHSVADVRRKCPHRTCMANRRIGTY